ncbi:MAG: hypothetical protein AUH10_09265 [Gammaproteobacteria bacterium 13_2_20CM_66_19]|nr:MAG: hypothetical protein AUH10_09265 [Gammaproteobacteria bacterium 13_2_20CM_66_19]
MPGFLWNATVRTPLALHLRILDAYLGGEGSGRVSLMSVLPIAADTGVAELNAAALHRFLAEAAWYPTALLPACGVHWSAISDHAALATLTDRGLTVSLEFRFNDSGEVTGIYTPSRYRRIGNAYQPEPWEGRFARYERRAGMRIPTFGEVGWYDAHEWRAAWRGELLHADYRFESR